MKRDVNSSNDPGKIKILLITAHNLWGQSLSQNFSNFSRCVDTTSFIVSDRNPFNSFATIPVVDWNVIIVSSPGFMGSELDIVQELQNSGYEADIMLVCSHYILPSFDELIKHNIKGIVATSASVEELELAFYNLIDSNCCVLKQQYLKAVRSVTYQRSVDFLNEREKLLVRLIAADLTDNEIAKRLGINVRTVNNQLRIIYAKLGVRGRAGAVGSALVKGIISPHIVITLKSNV